MTIYFFLIFNIFVPLVLLVELPSCGTGSKPGSGIEDPVLE
jgi:hypothetical protein